MNFQELNQRLKQIDEAPAGAITPVSNNPVNMQPQTVAPQANRPGLAPKGDPKLWDIQHELRKRGYKVTVDGLNGPQTEKFVQKAQADRNWVQNSNNPTAVNVGQAIGTAIGDVSAWIETTWRNIKQGYNQATGDATMAPTPFPQGQPATTGVRPASESINESFNALYKKIASLDGVKGLNENVTPIEECGDMASMMGGAHPVPPQQDNISMNVSMNAQGQGGIRDLMSVLQAIEQGTNDADAGAIVVHGTDDAGSAGDDFSSALDKLAGGDDAEVALGDKMADETTGMDMVPDDPDMNTGTPVNTNTTTTQDDEQLASEEYKNEPNEKYQSQDYMAKTLAGGADEPQHMKKHGYGNSDNPLGMKESLINDLASLYQEVKLR